MGLQSRRDLETALHRIGEKLAQVKGEGASGDGPTIMRLLRRLRLRLCQQAVEAGVARRV